MSNLKTTLYGTGVAIVTPFDQREDVDYDSLAKLIDFQIDAGVEYVVTLGTTGETPTLSYEEKQGVIDFTIQHINGRVPVVLGVGGNNTSEVAAQLHLANHDAIVAVLSASPYYNKPSQQGIYEHYRLLAKVSPRPLILYNVPGRTGSNITAETTLRLAKVENISGIKEASGNMVQCMHILRDCPTDFLVVSGDDHLALPLIACGAHGVISVVANCAPGLFSRLIRFALEGNVTEASKLQNQLLGVIDLLFVENNPAGVKAFLHELGYIQNVLRLPLTTLGEKYRDEVRKYLSVLK